jgi:hypothetical protein
VGIHPAGPAAFRQLASARSYHEGMSRASNRVDPAALGDLLAAPCRATLAWTAEGRLELAPVRYAGRDGRHYVTVPREGTAPGPDTRVSLVLDDGASWFELRAVTLRGVLAPASDPPPGGEPWLELVPARTTAWDYGAFHEEPDA